MLNSSDNLKLPGAFVWTDRHIQLRVVSVAVNGGKVHLDNIKQFACIKREKQWPEARGLWYTKGVEALHTDRKQTGKITSSIPRCLACRHC